MEASWSEAFIKAGKEGGNAGSRCLAECGLGSSGKVGHIGDAKRCLLCVRVRRHFELLRCRYNWENLQGTGSKMDVIVAYKTLIVSHCKGTASMHDKPLGLSRSCRVA